MRSPALVVMLFLACLGTPSAAAYCHEYAWQSLADGVYGHESASQAPDAAAHGRQNTSGSSTAVITADGLPSRAIPPVRVEIPHVVVEQVVPVSKKADLRPPSLSGSRFFSVEASGTSHYGEYTSVSRLQMFQVFLC